MHKKSTLVVRPIVVAVCTAVAGMHMAAAYAADDAAQDVKSLGRVEVTGSAIKRTQTEGPAPLEVLTKKQIESTGATTLNELVRSIPSLDIFDQGEMASNSPSGSGTATIRMRGLSENNVLVLLNGRRLPVNAMYDSSGAGAAVDINTIPVSAIERVEVLKDGASAIYGADAVAGVVNFITKKNYQGFEARSSMGISSRGDGKEQNYGVSGGFGNLDDDRYNVMVAVDYFKRDPIYRKDRDISKSSDFRSQGGKDGRSSYAPEGNYVDENGSYTGKTVRPCAPANFNGGRCRYDFNSDILTAYNGADRLSSMVLGNFKVTDKITGYAELMYSHSTDTFYAHPVPDYFKTAAGDTYAGRFMQGGPRTTDRDSSLANFATGLDGSSSLFDWKVGYSYGHSEVTNRDSNYFDKNKWDAAIAGGLLDATSTSNDQALVESLKVSPVRRATSSDQVLNAQISGELFKLPAGALGYATGIQYLEERLVDKPDALTQQGLVVGSVQQGAVAARRHSKGVFAEFDIPVLESLESQIAMRYDQYPQQSKVSPKIAFKYQPISTAAIRLSYAESFRPASLKQLFGTADQGAIDITESADCQNLKLGSDCAISAYQVGGANAALKPEKGKTINLGFVVEPTKWLNATVDFFRIRKSDEISQPTVSEAIAAGNIGRDADGRLLVYTSLINKAQTEVTGVDSDIRASFNLPVVGKLSLRNATTYYFSNKQKATSGSAWKEYIDTYGSGGGPLPHWRNVASVTSEVGKWTNTVSLTSIPGFWDADSPRDELPTGTRRVGYFNQFDYVGSYRGIKNFEFSYGVKNLFDKMPPFSVTNASNNAYTQEGFAELYSSRGRFYYAGLKYSI